jgi:predicted ATPase
MTAQDAAPPVIRTPDQRLRVFVSSTLAELADERLAVKRAITSVGLAPVMFELGARPHPPQELYRAYLAQSDVFVGLYWQSYGWVGPGMDISGLEDEFRLSRGKPRLLYLKAPAPDRQPELSAMIDELRAEGTDAYRTFTSPRELARLVRDDLVLLLTERFAGFAAVSAPDAQPPSAAPARTLPATSTSLIGREDDIDAVVAMLRRPDVRLVTITGPGGIGKTRLAIAVGEAISAKAPPPVVFVPLAAVSDPAEFLPRIASAAGVILEGTRPARDILIDRFDAQPTALILDNFEQIAGASPEVGELLAQCAGLTILATSRTALRLRAEHEYALGALSSGPASDDVAVDDAAELPAVRLFVDRAAAVGRRIDPSTGSITAIREICRRLDGLPLAIELAAARTRLLDPKAVLARLENVLDALGTGPVDLPERQRSLRATVEWSVGFLDEPVRDFLATLSIFVDGWTLDAAAAVSGRDEDTTLELLDTLAGHSLIRIDPTGAEPRFRMLNAVREFAGELLTDEARAETARRHAEFFAQLAEADVESERKAEWGDRLHADDDNIRVAVRWFFDNDLGRVTHLLRALWLYWQIYDRMPEARRLADEMHRRVDPADLDARSAGELLYTVAVTASEVGDDEAALNALDAIRPRLGEIDDPALVDALRLADAWIITLRGDTDGAIAAAEAAYQGYASRHDLMQASAALTLGMLNMSLGADDAARRYLDELDAAGDRLRIQWLTTAAVTHLALIDVRSGDLTSARDRLARLMARLEDGRVTTLSASLVLTAFGHLAVSEGRIGAAVTSLGAMDGLRGKMGVTPWPNSRRTEQDLRDRAKAAAEPAQWEAAYAAGSAMRMTDALGLVRAEVAAGSPAP